MDKHNLSRNEQNIAATWSPGQKIDVASQKWYQGCTLQFRNHQKIKQKDLARTMDSLLNSIRDGMALINDGG